MTSSKKSKDKRAVNLRRERAAHVKALKRERRRRQSPKRTRLKSETKLKKNIKKNNVKTLRAPEDYSFVTNHKEVSQHFEEVVKAVEEGFPVQLDLSAVRNVTVDALLYILVTLNTLRKNRHAYKVSGNFPTAKVPKEVFHNSGFLSHVKCDEYLERFDLTDSYYQIRSGKNNDSDVVKELVSFVIKKFNWTRTQTAFIYEAISEMMYNTVDHAYKPSEKFPSWYVMARMIDNDRIEIVFLDTGNGIPNTVNKSYLEKFQTILGKLFPSAKPSESEILQTAFDGKLRTRTEKGYRGRGLPSIYKFAANQHVESFRVITSHVNMCLKPKEKSHRDTSDCFKGCLYVWRLVK